MRIEPVCNQGQLFRFRFPAVNTPILANQPVVHPLRLELCGDALRLLERHPVVRIAVNQQCGRIVGADVVVGGNAQVTSKDDV